MKALITGGTGLLGGHITRQLCREGYSIRLFLRKGSTPLGLDGSFSEIYRGNLEDPDAVSAAVEGCDIVIHSASLTATAITDFKFYEAANVKGTINIVEAAKKHGVSKLIYVSTANTIGPGTKENPGTELSGFSLFGLNSGYINSKYLAQQYVLEQVEKTRLNAVVVNPTFIIGTHDYKPSSGKLILLGMKRFQFFPAGGKNFVPAADVATGVIKAVEKGKAGECYLLAGENLTYKEFFQKINQIIRKKPLQLEIPKRIFNAIGLAGTFAGKISGRNFPLNYTNTRVLSLDNYYSSGKAQSELGYKPTSIDTALKESIEWFLENSIR